jgi:hypothetical protein
MENKSFTTTIEVKKTPHEVFNCIKNVSKWWGGEDLEGDINEFTIIHGEAHRSKQNLVELIPDKRIVWHITNGKLGWLKGNKDEWTNTRLIFELSRKGNKTVLRFTHEGLVPELECYSRCADEGWAIVIEDYLYNFIEKGIAHF